MQLAAALLLALLGASAVLPAPAAHVRGGIAAESNEVPLDVQRNTLARLPPTFAYASPVGKAVLIRAQEQLAVTHTADIAAEANSKSLVATQQELVARMAREKAEEYALALQPTVPAAEAGASQARVYAMQAQSYADHARGVLAAARKVPGEAAEAAVRAIEAQIRIDANTAAETAYATAKADAPAARALKTASDVSNAVKPYHLALLRAQKETAETYAKAQSAMKNAQLLAEKARIMATNAQSLQARGMALQAQQLMMQAHGTMQSAAELKQWAEKLYAQANEINNSIGHYQLSESMAAANAAASVPVPYIPKFPEMPPGAAAALAAIAAGPPGSAPAGAPAPAPAAR